MLPVILRSLTLTLTAGVVCGPSDHWSAHAWQVGALDGCQRLERPSCP